MLATRNLTRRVLGELVVIEFVVVVVDAGVLKVFACFLLIFFNTLL